MENLLAFIADHMDRNGLNKKQFAKQIGVSPPTVSRWMKGGRSAFRESLPKLAAGMGFESASQLLEAATQFASKTSVAETPKPVDRSPTGFHHDDPLKPYAQPVPVPLWGDGEGFCPHGCVYFDRQFLDEQGLDNERCTVIKVENSSMHPSFPPNSICLVARDQRQRKDGQAYAFKRGPDAYPFIRWLRASGATWLLAADDKTIGFDPLGDDITLIGRVVWTARMVTGIADLPPDNLAA